MPARKKTLKPKYSVRLSQDVLPVKYKIHFEPDLDNFTFTGEEEITLEIKKPTNVIRMHSAEIEILSATLDQGKNEKVGKVSYKEKEEEVSISFGSSLKQGRAVLKIEFTGILNDKMRGFYRSRYKHDGREYHMGVTQFESTDARRAFPSFDEPTHKAVFEVSFKVPSDRTVISNTIESEVLEHTGGYKTIKFEPSPKMSSYLLAFIIGHFEFISQKTKDGTLVRVFVTPGKKKQAEFALSVAVKTLEFYTNYFKIAYPLPTADLIAIPDFAAGAMENWGAVTYRESAVLVDPQNSSIHNKQWVALVIAHELAHQWFGNLVTMEWWTHLWLNEGFASYIEYLAVDHMFPKWNIWTQFVYMDHARALELDGLKNTHPIEIDVHHPAEIAEIFDEVSYSKGASVIRMLAEYLGETHFRNGLRAYLKKHSYSNAKTDDLWKALEKVSKRPVQKIMDGWTKKPGYPLVFADLKNNGIELSQKRFFSSVESQKTQDKTIWMVPINVVSGPGWYKLNKNETSFIRVKYSPSLLKALKTPIQTKSKDLSEQDRFGILRDAFVLSEAGISSSDLALDLARSYKDEESYIVLSELAIELGKIKHILFGTPVFPAFQKYVVDLFTPISKKLGWHEKKGEEYKDTLLRSIVLGVMGRNKDKKTIEKALNLFKLDQKGTGKIDSNLRSMIYTLVAENGGEKEYMTFLNMYKKTTFEEERDRVLRALCSFTDKNLLQNTLELSFSKEARDQDAAKIIPLVWGNLYGSGLAWSFVKKNWNEIVRKYGGGGHLYSRFVKGAGNFVTEEKAKEVLAFYKTHESKGLERTIAQAVEQIRSSASWLSRDQEKISKFLKASISA